MPLRAPVPVCFVTIHEKHVDAQPSTGRFTALSRTGGVLETEAALERFSNIQIQVGGKLAAKVLNRMGEAWFLRFTSIPPEFDSWYNTVI